MTLSNAEIKVCNNLFVADWFKALPQSSEWGCGF